MSREILFRGKRLDNGEWVEGWYYSTTKGAWLDPIQNGHYIITFKQLDNGEVILTGCFEVDPATVGQYIGLVDKHGKKVFKGDIINCSSGCPHEVIWVQEHGGTFLGGMPTFYLSGLREGYAWMGTEEVIGNIHDPSMLEATT